MASKSFSHVWHVKPQDFHWSPDAVLHPPPPLHKPPFRSNVKHLLSSSAFLSCTQCGLCSCGYASVMVVSLVSFFFFFLSSTFAVYWVGEGDCTHACMSSAPGTIDGTSLFFSLSQLPHHPAPRSAAVNESGLIFLYLLHPTFNLGDEIDQENKRSYCILLYYVFDCLPSSLENSLRWYKTGKTGTDIHMTWGILVEELDHLGNALIGFFVKIEEWYCSLEY